MLWGFIKRLFRRLKRHWLAALFLGPLFWWVMSNFFTTPKITALAIIFIGYIMLAAISDTWLKSKICNLITPKICCYCVIYFGLLIGYILITLPFWNTLVYWCDRDSPYKKPLLIGECEIGLIAEPNGDFNQWGWDGDILLKKENNTIFEMSATEPILGEHIENNQVRYRAHLEFGAPSKYIGKPISHIAEANYAVISLSNLPPRSRIIRGEIIFTFNNSVLINIPIHPQMMDNNYITIKSVQKYFKKRN